MFKLAHSHFFCNKSDKLRGFWLQIQFHGDIMTPKRADRLPLFFPMTVFCNILYFSEVASFGGVIKSDQIRLKRARERERETPSLSLTVRYSTGQHVTAQHNTTQFRTAQFSSAAQHSSGQSVNHTTAQNRTCDALVASQFVLPFDGATTYIPGI